MAEFLISKQDEESPVGWSPVTVVQADTAADLRELVKQGYTGDGLYTISRWDNRRVFPLRAGPVEALDPPA